MRIRGAGMEPYQVTADDALWLARAVEAEGPIATQVAATLINGFAFMRSQRAYAGSLTTWIRSYAQPVNPRWYTSGDLFKASLQGKTEAEQAAARTVAEKRERIHSTRQSFTTATQDAVRAALNGTALYPSSATDYAAPGVDATGKGYKPLADPKSGQNRLWARPGADRWTGYLVDATDAWPWLIGLLVIGAVVAAAAKWGPA